MKKRKEKLESTYVLPSSEEVFVCEDPGRLDIWGMPMDNVHIEVRSKGKQTWYYCCGDIDGVNTYFGAELTLEGAYQVIKGLIPVECAVGKKAEHPVPENVSEESKAEVICHAGVEGASAESLPCADADLGDYDSCAGCPYLEVLGDDCTAPADVYGREDLPCGSDDPDRQKLQDEVKEAYLHGGRTGCMFDDDGNEYYTTIDGVRHYTRLEG